MMMAEERTSAVRVKLEKNRLGKLLEAHIERETDRRRQNGEANPVVDPKKLWPSLTDLATSERITIPMTSASRLTKLQAEFPTDKWKSFRPENFAQLVDNQRKRIERFTEFNVR